MACKKQEEQRKDYPEVSQALIGQCMLDSELTYGVDPEAIRSRLVPTDTETIRV